MSEPTVVCVLGMHRCGTSLVARVLNVLGVDLGPEEHLMRPSSANPAGHWESKPIQGINDEILSRFGGTWFRPPELVAGWERSPELAEPRKQARELIDADFSDSDLWGFKDPRNSLTAPFWQRILGPMRHVICLRNPLDVAASLAAREQEPVPPQEGVELWAAYVRAALAATAGHPREIIFYEDLMANPKRVVGRLSRFIGADRSKAAKAKVREAIEVAVSETLWHHRTAVPNVVDDSGLDFHVKAFYLALRLFVPSAEDVGAEVLDLLGTYASGSGRRLAELEAREKELDELSERSRVVELERTRLEQQLADLAGELKRVEKSRADEQRLRRRLEAEADAARAERAGDERRADRSASVPKPGSGSALVAEVQARARELIPSGATVLVAGKGEDALLALDGCRAWHFPRAADGGYAGYHPAGDTAVIAQLEALRAAGADHLLLPKTTIWWLDDYAGLRRHLDDHYQALHADEHCAVYRLHVAERAGPGGPAAKLDHAVSCLRSRTGRNPSVLDWRTGFAIANQLPEVAVFVPPDEGSVLPYLDRTADIVVVASTDPGRIAEARRVAAAAVIRVDPTAPEQAELDWLRGDLEGWGRDACVAMLPTAGERLPWEATLTALGETLNGGFAGELAIVGDAESIAPASERTDPAGVSVRRTEVGPGAGLAERARAAAQATDRRILMFIAAPAVPLPECLTSMVALFSADHEAGVVGARILSSEGVLKEAGGIVAADGSPRHRGEGDHDPDRPQYRFLRTVDFCSPPLLATSSELFERLAGFDEQAQPGGLIDFSLRAGRAGANVYYQPEARVVTIGEQQP